METYLIKDEPVKGHLLPADDIEVSASQSFIHEDRPSINANNGLSKEEVLQYQRDPFWVRLRWLVVILVLLLLISMIVFVVVFVILHPACPHRPKLEFHQKGIVYQVEVATFKDSDGDGVGDINGILSKLDYLKDKLGVDVICLHRFTSKSKPKKVDEVYGSKSDLKKLTKALAKKDMYMVVDLPASYLEKNDEEIISHWLSKYADGLRVIEGKTPLTDSDISRWKEIVSQVSSDTFKAKYFGTIQFNNPGIDIDRQIMTEPSLFASKFQGLYSIEWPNILLGSFYSDRLATVLEGNLYNIAHSLVLLLKGTPVILAGDEIALQGRNEIESYMKWNNDIGCGFTDNQEIGSYFRNITGCENNVLDAISSTGTNSLVQIYKILSKLRDEPSLSWGDVKFNETDNKIISFVREATGFDGYLVAANTGDVEISVDFQAKHNVPETSELVYFHSPESLEQSGHFTVGEELRVDNVPLKPGQLLVAKFVRSD